MKKAIKVILVMLIAIFMVSGLAEAKGAIKKVSSFFYKDLLGNGWIVGEIKNVGTIATENNKVIATLYDRNGKMIGVESSHTDLDILLPGEKSPFNILVEDNVDKVKKFSIKLSADATTEKPLRSIKVLNKNSYIGELDDFVVVGEVKNRGKKTARFVMVILILYDSRGTTVGCDSTFVEISTLAPGETSPFEISIIHDVPVKKGKKYRVITQAMYD